MSYRSVGEVPYDGTVCGLCNNPPHEPLGIQGWVFDQNLISCLECRKQGQSAPEEQVANPNPKILDRILSVLKRFR